MKKILKKEFASAIVNGFYLSYSQEKLLNKILKVPGITSNNIPLIAKNLNGLIVYIDLKNTTYKSVTNFDGEALKLGKSEIFEFAYGKKITPKDEKIFERNREIECNQNIFRFYKAINANVYVFSPSWKNKDNKTISEVVESIARK